MINQDNRNITVRQLLDKYGSNKGRTYGGMYDILLRPVRYRVHKFIEIGIGTMIPGAPSTMHGHALHADYKPGGSLRAFRDYLEYAQIYGIDNADDTQFEEPRIKTYLDDSTTAAPRPEWQQADVIIDDGLHTPAAQLATFNTFWPLLRPYGLYVIEDVLPEHEDTLRAALPDVPYCIARDNLWVRWLAIALRKCVS